ncbi:MAG: adventurous gliding motility protein GltJ [Archangiaceae bacterium]|nr:adventurous gliding motility protein GltJ [Archangiaceae bacterium]
MRFVCDSCRAQYMISDEKVGPKGVKVRCKKCGYVILVKKADANGHASKSSAPSQPQAPVPLSNDPDDALATQVMQNPLSGGLPSATLSTGDDSPGLGDEKTGQMPAQGAGLLDASEDEIGAVFDQVLNSGAHSIPKSVKEERADTEQQALGGEPDDRMSTRVIDSETVKKLAEESGGSPQNGNGHAPAKEVPKTDWFVAIDDKQTGPLTLEKIKEHWERGEIGPDSLCWRAGFSDWIPVSEVADLAAELAPRPSKPVMVAPVTVGGGMPGSVVSVPVESAFSAGGVMKSVRSEVQVPLAAAPPEETGSWRPSAASALASLVKEEMEALAKPPPKAQGGDPVGVGEAPLMSSGGLLSDLPEASMANPKKGMNGHSNPRAETVQSPGEMTAAHGPRNPYIANPGATYSSPGVSQYRPPQEGNKTAIIAIIALSLVAVLGIGAFVLVSLNKPGASTNTGNTPPPVQPQNPVAQPPAANLQANAQPAPAQPGQPVAQPNPAQPGQPAAAGQPAPAGQPAAAGQPVAANAPPAAAAQPAGGQTAHNKTTLTKPPPADKTVATREREPKAEAVEKPAKEEKKPIAEAKGGDDEFAAAFGSPKAEKKESKKAEDKPADESGGSKKSSVYIPPAPGQGGNIPESLGQADIMEVVKSNIGPIKKCVDEQKAKEPGTSGKLVMKWTIQTSGKATKVEVVSEEFKSTYLAGCVGGLIKTWQFPKHKTQGEPVVFPFKF